MIEENFKRIEEIFIMSESFWNDQLPNLPEGGVKYLLIAEAPPWSAEGEVTYVYNPKSKSRTLLKALYKAFFGVAIGDGTDNTDGLKLLAQQGLLIVDSLPFAMDYSSGGKRSKDKYKELVSECVKAYMIPKIHSSKIKWSEDLKIGFAFKVNGKAVISAIKNTIKIDFINKSYSLSEDMVVANKAGYPDSKLIKKVFELE